MSSVNKENTIHLPLYLWEIKSQSGCKVSQPKRHADCDHQTARRLDSKNPWKFSKSVRYRKTRQKFAVSGVAPLLGRAGATCKKLWYLQIYTRAVANFRDCAPNRSIPPFVSDGGKERRSFTFFWREIRGVCIEKSGGVCIRANPHTLTWPNVPSQPLHSFNFIFYSFSFQLQLDFCQHIERLILQKSKQHRPIKSYIWCHK